MDGTNQGVKRTNDEDSNLERQPGGEMSDAFDSQDIEQKMQECEKILEYNFQDQELLNLCLTHASRAKTRLESNERLEFLGDSVLGMVICEMLFRQFPEEPEGELTRIKSAVVSRNTCASISLQLGLEKTLLLGKGLRTHDVVPSSIVSAVIESVIAGVYLDGGIEPARELVERLFGPDLDRIANRGHLQNFKSLLQQVSQKTVSETPVYHLLDEKGPDHSKCFKVSAAIGSRIFSAAWGPTKKEAEQRAARNAISQLDGEEVPYPSG